MDSCRQWRKICDGQWGAVSGFQTLVLRKWRRCGDLAEEVMAFVNNVANNTKSVITPKQSYDALRVVDAIERSIREGKEVEL